MLSCSNTSCSACPIAERWCDFCGCSIKAKGARGSLTLSLRWPHIATTLRHLWPSQIPWLHSNPIEMYPMPKHSLMQKIEISRFALEWGPPQYRVIRKFAGKCGSPLPPWGSGNVDIRVDLFHIILNGTWGFDSKRASYATSAGLKSHHAKESRISQWHSEMEESHHFVTIPMAQGHPTESPKANLAATLPTMRYLKNFTITFATNTSGSACGT